MSDIELDLDEIIHKLDAEGFDFADMSEEDFLSLVHYASPYYDPVKAHEYYMRTRKLKGRSYGALSDAGKDAWAYVNDRLTEEEKAEIEKEKEKRDQKIEQHRKEAKEARERISEKLKQLNKRLKRKSGIIHPTNTARTREEALANKNSSSYSKEAAAAERKEVAENLKSVIAATREAFKKAKEDINAKYETLFQQEYDKIHAAYPKASKK